MNYLFRLEEYRNKEIEVLKNLDLEEVNKAMNILENARKMGHRIFICGNGGSASTASHYAGDFNKGVNLGLAGIKGHSFDRRSASEILREATIPLYDFECLSDNIPFMLAEANDESYDEIFRCSLAIKMKKGDILIGISGSGNSKNVINAFDYAKQIGGTTIAIVGYDGGHMKEIADCSIHVKIDDMQISEDLHMFLDHMMMSVLSNSNEK